MDAAGPRVSVVMSTYNRPRVLASAIRSVLAQTMRDFELIVVGDACRDETGEAVATFADPRLRYHNLSQNFGEQSGPNNVGVGLARVRTIAFLNHDDLWFPDHLAAAVTALEGTGADLVYAPHAWLEEVAPADLAARRFRLSLAPRDRCGAYDPVQTMAPASTMVFRREVFERVGPWRPGRQLYAESSQDFLFRAWRAGMRLLRGPRLSVLMLGSGSRDKTYVSDPAWEQEALLAQMATDAEGLRAAVNAAAREPRRSRGLVRLRNTTAKLALRGLAHLGVSPRELLVRYNGGRGRGGVIRRLREKRGLPALAGD